ncbi:non-hydrolyzing UDP-N-acetylglucosamine 2-epimerase [Alkalispirochaeta alkalica]|uniref:non-hydrolyzing UDP-N-acetylglucosamine 2-epimerase n=1 Tax=Alkalispirochaeta alkalica TaxID=46356 RepID=UPI0003A5ED34|nr:UDP-N-acetylglucosamine 2-epimerase (non-hydrolyzing) [Alkalispirochaeta alkalica]
MTIVGTRPELIKLSLVLRELDRAVDHVLVHTGQNYDYELNQVFFEDLEIRKPDHFLDSAGDTAAETISNVISRVDKILEHERPDAVLVYGDTNSCLSVIPAKRRKIPVFHMEAGNRCFDQRVPEELNRKVVDHLSDINMTITEHARRYLVSEGLRPETIIKVGSSMPEIFEHFADRISKSRILDRLQLVPGEYFVASIHREENVDSHETLQPILSALDQLSETFNKKVIFSVHPRTCRRIESGGFTLPSQVHLMKPLGFFDYIQLQKNAACVVSDSGTVTEESSLLGFPAVTLRTTHERPEGMDEGTVVMTGLDPVSVIDSVATVMRHHETGFRPEKIRDYHGGKVSHKVVRIILSYIDYVNTYVWKKNS